MLKVGRSHAPGGTTPTGTVLDRPVRSRSTKKDAVHMESVNRRLDTRDIRLIEHATERLKIKASVAADSVRTWQPNGPPPEPDPELQALIDLGGARLGRTFVEATSNHRA